MKEAVHHLLDPLGLLVDPAMKEALVDQPVDQVVQVLPLLGLQPALLLHRCRRVSSPKGRRPEDPVASAKWTTSAQWAHPAPREYPGTRAPTGSPASTGFPARVPRTSPRPTKRPASASTAPPDHRDHLERSVGPDPGDTWEPRASRGCRDETGTRGRPARAAQSDHLDPLANPANWARRAETPSTRSADPALRDQEASPDPRDRKERPEQPLHPARAAPPGSQEDTVPQDHREPQAIPERKDPVAGPARTPSTVPAPLVRLVVAAALLLVDHMVVGQPAEHHTRTVTRLYPNK